MGVGFGHGSKFSQSGAFCSPGAVHVVDSVWCNFMPWTRSTVWHGNDRLPLRSANITGPQLPTRSRDREIVIVSK